MTQDWAKGEAGVTQSIQVLYPDPWGMACRSRAVHRMFISSSV
jgi:hypothetical protein